MHVLITRPTEDATALAAALQQSNIQSTTEPLLDIVYLDGPLSDLSDMSDLQGLLITSANGIRAFSRLSARRDLVVWAVGDASARTARELGFTNVRSASGDVGALATLVGAEADPKAGVLLHIAGTRRAGDLAGLLENTGFSYRRCVLYEAEAAAELSAGTRSSLAGGLLDGVLLYSPRTAAIFGRLVENADLINALQTMTAFCLSPVVADKIGDLGWKQVVIAPSPDETSLITKVLEVARKV